MAPTADRNVNHELRARFAEVQGQYERMRDGLADLQRQLGQLEVTVTSTDELVTATVNARGQLIRLNIDRRAFRESDPDRLAESITATTRTAATEASERTATMMSSILPATSGAPSFARTGDFGDLLRRYDERHSYREREERSPASPGGAGNRQHDAEARHDR
jgi:DNA-binding protein YbaB